MNTRVIQEINLDKNSALMKYIFEAERKKRALEWVKRIEDKLNQLCKKNWIQIENEKIYYIVDKNMIMADITRVIPTIRKENEDLEVWKYLIEELEFKEIRPLSIEEMKDMFYERNDNNPFIKNDTILGQHTAVIGLEINSEEVMGIPIIKEDEEVIDMLYIEKPKKYDFSNIDYNYLIIIGVYDIEKENSPLELLLSQWIPMDLTEQEKAFYKLLQKAYQKNWISIENGQIQVNEKLFFNPEMITSLKQFFNEKEVVSITESKEIDHSKQEAINQYLLNKDIYRAQIEPYHSKVLTDPNMGHWELWNMKTGSNSMKLTTPLIARNPVTDIHKDGIVGIDFGTKSTIVVYQDGNDQTRPMRVGSGNLNKKVSAKDYENPTVMEFINLSHFLEKYHEKVDRPETLWEDVTISHTARNSLFSSNIKSDEYYAFFNDLKQWAGDKDRVTRIRDKQGVESILPSFLEIKETDFNPIEFYAYYLGLFINNMYNGIYLNYMLSFPVTYEKAVREKIIESFERGLKKSLPEAVLEDAESMKKFRVLQGASEPAAYEICALQEYGFEPEEDEEIFYGIFDFGGGTTDFDFGIWKCADESERRYDYVIQHFGAGGDQYLGGENLLELLAYEVFKDNQDALIKEGITFYKPTECNPFAGSEMLISNSQEARLNTKQLMEKLRPLWEEHTDYEKIYQKGMIKVMLFNRDGQPKPNVELVVEIDRLRTLLEERIEKGVKNFFEALKLTFTSQEVQHMKEVAIFLAGNSSQSPIVKVLFNKHIEQFTKDILNKYDGTDITQYFKIYPPLGTEESKQIQKGRGIECSEVEDLLRPTGKTGVAYGLLEGRPGSRIKIESELKATDEVKFKYYLGYVSRKKFKVCVHRSQPYYEWVPFTDASEVDFELYYMNLPEATTNQLSSKQVSKKICCIDNCYNNADIYVRIVEPTKLEYVVMGQDGTALNEIQSIEL